MSKLNRVIVMLARKTRYGYCCLCFVQVDCCHQALRSFRFLLAQLAQLR